MDHKKYQSWVSGIDELSLQQKEQAQDLLSGVTGENASLMAIEAQLAETRLCPHCNTAGANEPGPAVPGSVDQAPKVWYLKRWFGFARSIIIAPVFSVPLPLSVDKATTATLPSRSRLLGVLRLTLDPSASNDAPTILELDVVRRTVDSTSLESGPYVSRSLPFSSRTEAVTTTASPSKLTVPFSGRVNSSAPGLLGTGLGLPPPPQALSEKNVSIEAIQRPDTARTEIHHFLPPKPKCYDTIPNFRNYCK